MGLKQFLTNNLRLVNSNNLFINRCANSILESHNTGYAQKAVEIQLPIKPKKPTPPFFQFLQERRVKVVKEHNINMKDAIRVISEMWKNYDVDSKNKMNEIYNKELEQYKEVITAYKQSLTEDQKNELFRVKYEEIEQKTKRKLKKELKELGKPRKPLTSYLMFVTEEIKKRGDEPVQKYMTTIANKWRAMDSESRKKYMNAASVEYDNYINALQKWESDMLKAGRVDLVRIQAISEYNTDDK